MKQLQEKKKKTSERHRKYFEQNNIKKKNKSREKENYCGLKGIQTTQQTGPEKRLAVSQDKQNAGWTKKTKEGH